uniref:Uncharacterized protein n=1 Tax=Cacopsylla melanoneura TaxID=428564 RepID=A0A8D9EAH4_9HEMI
MTHIFYRVVNFQSVFEVWYNFLFYTLYERSLWYKIQFKSSTSYNKPVKNLLRCTYLYVYCDRYDVNNLGNLKPPEHYKSYCVCLGLTSFFQYNGDIKTGALRVFVKA